MAKISSSDKFGWVSFAIVMLVSLLLWVADGSPVQAIGPEPGPQAARNFDARVDHNQGFSAVPRRGQEEKIQRSRDSESGLAVTFDKATGVTRSLLRRGGHLSAQESTSDAMTIAQEYIAANYELLGLNAQDLADYEVTDEVYSAVTGATHIYLRQTYLGLPVYNGQLHINIDGDGRVMSVNNATMPDIAGAANAHTPGLSAAAAVAAVADHLGVQLDRLPEVVSQAPALDGVTKIRGGKVSRANIEARLMWLPIRAGDARLVWNFQAVTLDDQHVYDLTVDAVSGQVWTRFDWVANDSYRVFPVPLESPNHAGSPPPADGRQVETDPADAIASPYGWHDTDGSAGAEYTKHRGNNAHAYDDSNNGNPFCTSTPSPPAVEPDCGGSLDCDFDFAIDFSVQQPSSYIDGAVTNLFYWNNLIHDVQYLYGFDEAAGNFQSNNYGNGGNQNDYVLAEAQDGSGANNANFCTPPDGSRPRMQMYVWTSPSPDIDGDFDNGIILHEYGHGISNRLVGGPSSVSCLNNAQQPGEGLSDWWSLAYTAETGDDGTDGRGIGTYALNQPTSGPGIREQRYSTDQGINNHTYESIFGMRIPHGVGEVWAQGAWEVYWALVDEHGFDPDLYNAMGGSGNQRAMLYVNEGLKNTACSPTFTDVRDGMILAAQSLQSQLGGQDDCLMWEAFAAFGLGVDAVSGGSNSIDPTNGFAVPAACQNGQPTVTINASDATATEAGPTSGEFTVTRGGDPLPALTVSYTVGGGASSGSDYAALSGSVSLAATETTATISVDPIDDPDVESDETVIVTLSADATYNVGSPSQATVTIESDDTPTGGGSGSVKGSTRDEFGAKLAGVLVTVDTTPNPDPSASSNNGGKYNIASVAESAPGTPWLVIATKDDYCMDGSPEAVVNAGLTTTVDITMNVGECGPPPSGPTASFTYDCTALSCQFTDTSSEGDSTIDTWLWTFGDGNSSTEQNPLYVYASSGTRQVTLTVEDLEDDSDSTSQDVTVTDTSDPPPTVTGCSPASANQNDRLPVTVTGTYFQNGATVDFGTRVSVQGVSYIDDEQLVVQVKVHKRAVSGPRTVTVDNPVGPSATGIGCFSVE